MSAPRVASRRPTNAQAQAVVLLLLGGAIVKISLTGTYLRYVKAGLQPLLIAAGALLITAAVITLWHDLRRARDAHDAHDHHAGDDDGHGHTHQSAAGWLLMLPVLGLLLLTPPALGSSAASQAGSVLGATEAPSDYPPLPAGNPVPLDLLDYASRAVFDRGASLGGRDVQLTGFLTPGADGQPMIARMILNCCAADGRPIKVALSGDAPTGVPADTWITVVGTYDARTAADPVNDAMVPFLAVRTWHETTAPEQPYEIAPPPQ